MLSKKQGTQSLDPRVVDPWPKGQSPLTRFLKRKALMPWCPRFGAGENLLVQETLVSLTDSLSQTITQTFCSSKPNTLKKHHNPSHIYSILSQQGLMPAPTITYWYYLEIQDFLLELQNCICSYLMNTFFKKNYFSKNSKAYCDRDFWLHCSLLLNKFFSLPEKPDEKGIWCL